MNPPNEPQAVRSQPNRRWIKFTLILLGSLLQLFRIANVQSTTGETPFLSANDRSRWCTILALTVNGNYIIDDVVEIRAETPPFRRTWYTIDMVQHRGPDGKQHYYSSKPPLLPTMYAGVYWLVRAVTGQTLTSQPFLVARTILVLVNLLPLILLWWLLLKWADRLTVDWQFLALAVFAIFGTFLSTFAVTLNNHLPAAVAVAVSLWAIEMALKGPKVSWWYFAIAGLATSFTAANELPALSWVAIAGLILAKVDVRKTLMAYLPALIPIAVAFFATNYIAHGTLRPAYSQRAVGAKIAVVQTNIPDDLARLDPTPIEAELRSRGIELSNGSIIRQARREGVYELWDEASQWRIALRVDGPNQLGLYHWGDWYDYPNSYWIDGRKKGVDLGESSRIKYAFHCLVGSHGMISLTPFWIVALLGLFQWNKNPSKQKLWQLWLRDSQQTVVLAISITTIVVIGFYLARPLEDRNYGGVCCGLRWSFWLIPLWYWLAVKGIVSIGRAQGKLLVGLLLVASLFSANYAWNNPWTSPWPVQVFFSPD